MHTFQNNGFKSVGSKALGVCLLLLAGLSFLACPTDDPSADEVERVTVTMTNPSPCVVKGATQVRFTATVEGADTPAQTVEWTVIVGVQGTTITADGILTVAANETAATLTIRATSTQDPTKFGELTVMVADDGGEAEKTNFTVGAADFATVMRSISDKPGTYTVTLTEDVINYPGVLLETAGVKITVKGAGKKITWKYDLSEACGLFDLRDGHLVLENMHLSHAEDTENEEWALIIIIGSGTVEVKDGVILTGNGEDTEHGIYLEGGTFSMSGGEISGFGTGISLDGNGTTATISGGIFSDNNDHGISISGTQNTVTVSGGTFSDNYWSGIGFLDATDCKLTITGGTFTENRNENGGAGISVFETARDSIITISGATISNNETGVHIKGARNTVTISGGTISNNHHGVTFWDATDCTLTIEDGASISNNTNFGIGVWDQNWDITIIMSGGTISGNGDWCAVGIQGENCNFIMEGGTISNNTGNGIIVQGTKSTVTMSGGTISGNGNWGLIVNGSGSSFGKTGGVIYGKDAGDNKNGHGAISVEPKNNRQNDLHLYRNAEGTETFAAKINAEETDIESQEGNWN